MNFYYQTLLPNEYENFGRYIRQDPQLPDEFYYLLSSLSEPDSFEVNHIMVINYMLTQINNVYYPILP